MPRPKGPSYLTRSVQASELTDTQRLAVMLMAMGYSGTYAAKTVGVGVRTLQLWRKNKPQFDLLLREIRDEAWQGTVAQVQSLYVRALDTLGQLLDDSNKTLRLKAAAVIFRGVTQIQASQGQMPEQGWSDERIRAEIDRLRAEVIEDSATDTEYELTPVGTGSAGTQGETEDEAYELQPVDQASRVGDDEAGEAGEAGRAAGVGDDDGGAAGVGDDDMSQGTDQGATDFKGATGVEGACDGVGEVRVEGQEGSEEHGRDGAPGRSEGR